jgi:putative pyruvate formate lyase activating enzyme
MKDILSDMKNTKHPSGKYQALIASVRELMSPCRLCERKCGVNRIKEERGFCGLGTEAFVFRDFLHFGEEPELIPSHTVYFTGCNFRCAYCSNKQNVDDVKTGIHADCVRIASHIDNSFSAGAKNANFLGGEPTVNLLAILGIMEKVRNEVPVVWNSNMYMTTDAMELISSFAKIYLADFKYGNERCAKELSGLDTYFLPVARNILAASKSGEVIVRHLPLKGHVECCSKPVMKWISENIRGVKVHLLKTFIPIAGTCVSVACKKEIDQIEKYMDSIGIKRTAEIGITERMQVLKKMKTRLKVSHETNIVINSDGTVSIQDLDGALARIAGKISSN